MTFVLGVVVLLGASMAQAEYRGDPSALMKRPQPLGAPMFVVVSTQDQFEVGAVPLSPGVGFGATAIFNMGGDKLLVPLQLKLGNGSFRENLETAVQNLDPEIFGDLPRVVPDAKAAPEGALVLLLNSKPIIARKYQTLFVLLEAIVCERRASAKEGCEPLYANAYFYEFGLPIGSPKVVRKSKRAEIWESLPDGKLRGMIVEGIAGAVDLLNLDFRHLGRKESSKSRVRHSMPNDLVESLRFVSEEGDRRVLRLRELGPLFSVETRIPAP